MHSFSTTTTDTTKTQNETSEKISAEQNDQTHIDSGSNLIKKPGGYMEAEGDINGNTLPADGVPRWGPQHAGAQQLAGMYSDTKRLQETIATYTAAIIGAITAALILSNVRYQFLPYMLIGFVLAGLVADFFSGLVHWAADSWGSVDLPIIGKGLLRPFREHHIDPTSITRHDFIETSGDLCAVAVPLFTIISYCQIQYTDLSIFGLAPPSVEEQTHREYGTSFFLFVLAILVVCTNEIHKWSHTYFGLPKWIEFLQWAHLVVPKKQHRLHHISPHDTHFCITTGWLNYPLHWIGFWPKLEYVITAITGVEPRTDDLKWASKVTIR